MWLWLLLVMRPHNHKTQKILESSGYDIRRACVSVRDGAFEKLSVNEFQRARDTHVKDVNALQRLCDEKGISIIPFDHPDYPEKLRLIDNPPVVLFARGDLRCLKGRRVISAVGTRNPSEYSLRTAETLCASVAGTGAAVVSGLALGLDTAAHRGALRANGVTVGVLACGHLVDYPAGSHDLKNDIIRRGGAVISELLPNEGVSRGYFDERNRLISGVADAVVVLEAAARSGALLTAKHAFEQRRRVFFIPPHDLLDERYSGARVLYNEGAAPVFGYEDIVNAFTLTGETGGRAADAAPPKPAPYKPKAADPVPYKPASSAARTAARPSKAKTETVLPQERTTPEGLGRDEAMLYRELMKGPLDVDNLVVRTEIYYRTVMELLMEMEINGLVERRSDGTYSIV